MARGGTARVTHRNVNTTLIHVSCLNVTEIDRREVGETMLC